MDMENDYTDFLKEKLKEYNIETFEIGKTAEFHIKRAKKEISLIKEEIINMKFLKLVTKEKISGEIRYNLYFVYSKKKGMKYTITLRNKNIRLITTIPLGRRTLRKTGNKLKKTFKKESPFEWI